MGEIVEPVRTGLGLGVAGRDLTAVHGVEVRVRDGVQMVRIEIGG